MRKRAAPPPELNFAGSAVPERDVPALEAMRPPEPEIAPPPGRKVVARHLFYRAYYPDPALLERTIQAAQAAIRAERPGGGRPWVDRSNPVLIRVGRLGPSTST